MGVYGEWQPIYAEAGLVSFPVDTEDKKPAIGNWQIAGPKASATWASRPGLANRLGLGLGCGKRNRLTVLDIDEPDENLLADAFSRFGASPVVIRTASGKFHAWYRHNGESRKIKGVIEGRAVDLLGAGGYAIAPPSQTAKGAYEFIQGGLADIGNLPVLQNLDHLQVGSKAAKNFGQDDNSGKFVAPVGTRNDYLFKLCLREARSVADGDALRAFALNVNQSGDWEPLPVDEVLRTATSAWEKQASGQNWVGSGARLVQPVTEFDRVFFHVEGKPNPVASDAYYLLSILRRLHFDKDSFVCANAMHSVCGWPLRRFRSARQFLEQAGCLVIVRPASAKDNLPSLYRFGPNY
jgi:hypothetical protein